MPCYLLSLTSKQMPYKLADLISVQNANERVTFRSVRIQSINANPVGSLIYGGDEKLSGFSWGWELKPGESEKWISEQNNVNTIDKFVMGSVDGMLIAVDLRSA